jgi:hypothetical protein
MVKEAFAPILVGCGILLFIPHPWLQIDRTPVFGLSALLFLTALAYTAYYINTLWGKKEYRLIKKSIYALIISIVLCSAINILIITLFPIQLAGY